MKTPSKTLTRLSMAVCLALVLQTAVAYASPASAAGAEAFGLSAYDSSGAVLIVKTSSATASLSSGATSDVKDVVYAGAGSLVESATLHTEADAATESSLTASLQQKLTASTATPPSAWNGRGFATTSQLRALKDALTGNHLLTADAIDAEAVVACDGANLVYGTAARMSNLKLAGQTLDGIIADSPNQTYEAAGVKLIFWETSFDQATNTVSVNGLHVIVPGALGTPDTHIIVSHSEASATCPQLTTPGPLDHFQISPIGDQVAGEPFSVTVTAYDAAGNVKTDYSGTPVLTSDLSTSIEGCGTANNDACAPQLSLGPFTDGVATATITAYKAETSRVLTVSDGTITESSGPFSLAPGATDHLEVSGPASATVGVPVTFTVRAHDLYGNIATYTGTVNVTSTDTTAALPSDYTFVAADAGTKDLTVIFDTTGEHTVSATDTTQLSITGSSDPVVVTQPAQGPSAPTITSVPTPDPGNDKTVSWSFTGEPGATYECVLERPGTPVLTDPSCSSPAPYDLDASVDGSGDGTYTFKVRQTTASGTSAFASESYTLDTEAPDTSIDTAPSDPGNDDTPTWTFSSTEPGSSFECRRTRDLTVIESFSPCNFETRTYDLSGEIDGTYLFEVRATDAAGNTDTTSSADLYTLDRAAAAPDITSVPTPDPGNDKTVSWSFSGEPGATYECVLERPGAAALTDPTCSSPASYDLDAAVDGSGDGTYTFKVKQTDAAGNSSVFASETYTLDTIVPIVTLSSPADSAETGSTPTFSGTAGDAPGDGSLVTVVIYGGSDATGTPAQILTATALGGSFEVAAAALPPGTYTAQAEQADTAGNTVTSAPVTFTVVSETGSPQPSPSPTPEPSPDPGQEPPPSPIPTPEPSPDPGQEPPPSPSPAPEPSPDPEPDGSTCDLTQATICGTDGADDLTDTAGDNVIVTGVGDDTITITGGTDVVRSGPGNDVITVVAGTVVVYAGAGDDIIRCAGGADRVFAGGGSDLVACRGGDDIVAGGPGDDELHGNRGSDRIRGGGGNDVSFGGRGPDHLRGAADDDALRGGRGADLVRGGAGDDALLGRRGPDHLHGGAADDALRGGRGADTLRGGPGRDSLRGGPGQDVFADAN